MQSAPLVHGAVLHGQDRLPREELGDVHLLILIGFLIALVGWLARRTQGRGRTFGRVLRWVISPHASKWLIVIGLVMVVLGFAGRSGG